MSDNYLDSNVSFFEEEFLIAVASLDDDGKRSKKKYAPGCGCMTLITIVFFISLLVVLLIVL